MNKELFIEGYLTRIKNKFQVDEDTAFEIFAITTIVDKTFQEVFDNIQIKGNQDGGVDGVLFVEQGGSYTMLVFQCKNKRGLTQNQIEKFRRDTEEIFKEGKNKPNTENLVPKIDEYKQLSRDGFIVDMKCYFVYRGDNNDPSHAANHQLYQAFNKSDEFEIWDSEALFKKIDHLIKAQNRRKDLRFVFHPEPSNITLSGRDPQGLFTYSIGNVRAANFRINANELCKLVEDEVKNNNTYDFLFSDNIRGFLGLRTRPNRRMRDTLSDQQDAVLFPLLNNGVTIICKRLEIPTAPQDGKYLLPTSNPVIVNGLQTTRVIYDVYTKAKEKGEDGLRNVFVNIRLYETEDVQVIDKITDATNTQTPINYRDKVSNKSFSTLVKEVFEQRSIAYIHKRGEVFSNQLSKQLHDSIDSDTLLKFWYASFYEQPETAKNSISKVLEEIYDAANNDHPLRELFNGDIESPIYRQLLDTYKIYRFVQNRLSQDVQRKDFAVHISELLAYGIYKRLENNLSDLSNDHLEDAYSYAFGIIEGMVNEELEEHNRQGKAFSYNGYFKKPRCRIEYNHRAGIIEDDNILATLKTRK